METIEETPNAMQAIDGIRGQRKHCEEACILFSLVIDEL